MTETYHETGDYHGPAIPVIVERLPSPDIETIEQEVADRVSYNTYLLTGVSAAPQLILPYNARRTRALLYVAKSTSNPFVTIHYDPSQLANGVGYQFQNSGGASLEIKNKRPLYVFLSGAGGSCTLSVIDEWYNPKDEIRE